MQRIKSVGVLSCAKILESCTAVWVCSLFPSP